MDDFMTDEEYIDPYDLWEERMLEIGKPLPYDETVEEMDEGLPFD